MRAFAYAVSFCLAAGSLSLAIAGGLGDVKKKDTLVVLTSPGYAPFEMRDKNGALMGLDVEVARKIKEAAGVGKLEWKEVQFEKLFDALAKGDGDLALSGISITDERKKQVDFSEPYTQVGKALLIRKGADAANLKTIVTAAGTTSEEAAKKEFPKAKLKTLKDESEAAKEVLDGKADGMVFDEPFVHTFCKRHEGKVEMKKLAGCPAEQIGAAVSKGNADLLKLVNETIAKLKQDGSLAKLEKEYFDEMAWMSKVAE